MRCFAGCCRLSNPGASISFHKFHEIKLWHLCAVFRQNISSFVLVGEFYKDLRFFFAPHIPTVVAISHVLCDVRPSCAGCVFSTAMADELITHVSQHLSVF